MTSSSPLLNGRSTAAILVCLCLGLSFPWGKSLAFVLTLALWVSAWLRNPHPASVRLTESTGDRILLFGTLVCLAELRFGLAYPHIAVAPSFLIIPILIREIQVLRLQALSHGCTGAAPVSFLDPWYHLVLMSTVGFSLLSVALVEDFLQTIDPHLLKTIEFTLHWWIWVSFLSAAILAVLTLVDRRKSTPEAAAGS
jgi:hypothetical protein